MENRFLEKSRRLREGPARGAQRGVAATGWASPLSATQRALVILIENGGIDLGIAALVDRVLEVIPQGHLIPADHRAGLSERLNEAIKKATDGLLESAELAASRYSDARPEHFGEVLVLRDSTATYRDLKAALTTLAKAGKIVDLFVLTHGDKDFISVTGGVDSAKIRAMRAEHGNALTIRTVYMMNCVASSLNQAWIDAGARASAGSIGNNYLPEPTMYFFWNNWKDGQPFETAVTSAYRRTVALLNGVIRAVVGALPIPGAGVLASLLDVADWDFVQDSAPVVLGQRTLTITSDDLAFGQTVRSGPATTVMPVSRLTAARLSRTASVPANGTPDPPRSVSPDGFQFLQRWCGNQGPQPLGERVAQAERAVRHGVTVGLRQHQFDALVSFVCGIGERAFAASTLLRLLNAGDNAAVPVELHKWVKAKRDGVSVAVPELARRRAAEAELYAGIVPITGPSVTQTYVYRSPSPMFAEQARHPRQTAYAEQAQYSYAQNPLAVVALADAAQIGLAAIGLVQTQVNASTGSFTLQYDKVNRMLTNEARQKMPGAQSARNSYSHELFRFDVPRAFTARAVVVIAWEGNAYGEIGTPVIRLDLDKSTEWSHSSAALRIGEVRRIPLPDSDPRAWPIVFEYSGSYDPVGNGHWEFNGEFELNAFGGLRFPAHKQTVVSRSMLDVAIVGDPEDYVVRGGDVVMPWPEIPAEQMAYLRTKLP